MPMLDGTTRFSSKVDNYRKYRPTYPAEVIDLLRHECGLTSEAIVADIAYGTGLFTKLLLETGSRVIGVEPNAAMRQAGEEYLAGFKNFESVAGTAEATTLGDHSVDLVTAAQAAHWFDVKKARQEFTRILKPERYAVLLWNKRSLDATPFASAYEQVLLDYATDYKEIRHDEKEEAIALEFFGDKGKYKVFPWRQEFDYEGAEGRMLSSSYVPQADHPRYGAMLADLKRVFDKHRVKGQIRFDYETQVFYGQIS
ncbi:MAG: class I SAM-dependent methyltransferase [Terriglobales bacterium]